jgi:hypothetical protein
VKPRETTIQALGDPALLSAEARLLILLSRLRLTADEVAECRVLLSGESLRFSSLTFYLLRHRVAPMAHRSLVREGLIRLYPPKWRSILSLHSAAVRARNRVLYHAVTPVLNNLVRAGLKPVVLKGTWLNNAIYPEPVRYQSDVDILFAEAELSRACEVIEGCDFVQGFRADDLLSIRPATRQEKVSRRLTMHEVVPFLSMAADPFCDFVEIDVQFDIFARGRNLSFDFDLSPLFAAARPAPLFGGRASAYALSLENNVLQLCAHFYRDATTMAGIASGSNCDVSQLADIYEVLQFAGRTFDWDLLLSRVAGTRAAAMVYFALAHVDWVYGPLVPPPVLEALRTDDEILCRYAVETDQPRTWDRPFLDRVFAIDGGSDASVLTPGTRLEYDRLVSAVRPG